MSPSGFELQMMSARECVEACDKIREERAMKWTPPNAGNEASRAKGKSMNTSGWEPVEFNVIVQIDKVEEKTKGGIFLPDQHKDREQSASVMGMMLEASPVAFTYEEWPEGSSKPKAGDRVLIAKYAGTIFTGIDGEEYRMCKDKDILAVRTTA